jgi:hypothetical protein
MITGIRTITNRTQSAVAVVRSDVPRGGNSDHLVLVAGQSQLSDWNVPWADETIARMLAADASSNDGRGIKIISGNNVWVIWQEVRANVDALWMIHVGSPNVAMTAPRNAPGGTIRIEIDDRGPSVRDY